MKKKLKKNKKRGRPKGSKNRITSSEEIKKELPYIPPKSHKFLGYCCKCSNIISNSDMVSKTIYCCPFCGKRERVNKLKKERPRVSDVTNKKEFLKDTLVADYHDMPSLEEPEIKL